MFRSGEACRALVWLLSSGLYPILHTHPPSTLPSTPSLYLFTNVVLFACVLHRHRCAGLNMDGYLIPVEQNVIGIAMSNNSLKVITPVFLSALSVIPGTIIHLILDWVRSLNAPELTIPVVHADLSIHSSVLSLSLSHTHTNTRTLPFRHRKGLWTQECPPFAQPEQSCKSCQK